MHLERKVNIIYIKSELTYLVFEKEGMHTVVS